MDRLSHRAGPRGRTLPPDLRGHLVHRMSGKPGVFAWIYWVPALAEFRVDLYEHGSLNEGASYFTDDRTDAYGTAALMCGAVS